MPRASSSCPARSARIRISTALSRAAWHPRRAGQELRGDSGEAVVAARSGAGRREHSPVGAGVPGRRDPQRHDYADRSSRQPQPDRRLARHLRRGDAAVGPAGVRVLRGDRSQRAGGAKAGIAENVRFAKGLAARPSPHSLAHRSACTPRLPSSDSTLDRCVAEAQGLGWASTCMWPKTPPMKIDS